MLIEVNAQLLIARHCVVSRLKTDIGMLPQFVPLEARRSRHAGKNTKGLRQIAGLQHSRGQTRRQDGRLKGSLRSTRNVYTLWTLNACAQFF